MDESGVGINQLVDYLFYKIEIPNFEHVDKVTLLPFSITIADILIEHNDLDMFEKYIVE